MSVRSPVSHFLPGVVLLLFVTAAAAQQRRPPTLNHRISAETGSLFFPAAPRVLPDTLHVLAVLVEFLPDNDPLTTGNGTFDTSTTAGQIVDSPPHDLAYFQNHLAFLHNYWRKVTNGKIVVLSDVVDTTIRLANPMRLYSPPSGSQSNRELAMLVHDTWRKVDSLRPSFDYSPYDAFCIFHAGTGRDVDLVSLLGFDPSPFDLPSLFFNLRSLQRALGPGYLGVPMQDSSLFITNSMVLPETENRLLPSIGGEVLLELGINGLLAASLGSYLGLPDLFDTRTGRSGIGRFGLMDGQSIFSWNGLFPPEPSAWEKYFLERTYNLGMLTIIDVRAGQALYDLPAVSADTLGRDTLARVSISPREYFLLENRNRDARRDSAVVWLAYNGLTFRRAFLRDTVGFEAFDQSELYGVLTDVDEFDFSLPGGVSSTGEFFDGGVLVWHVDENVIERGYPTNSVNADPGRRGLDLEEADGSQDIGQSYGFLDPGSGSEAGTPLDFWFRGNAAPVYRNEFGSTTFPNSLSNAGANSHIVVKDFPSRAPAMKVTIQLGDSLVRPLPGYPRFVGRPATDASPQVVRALFVTAGDSVFALRPDTAAPATQDARGLFASKGGRFPVAAASLSPDTTLVTGVQDSTVYVWRAVDGNQDGVFESILTDSLKPGGRLTTPLLLRTVDRIPSPPTYQVLAGDEQGRVYVIQIDSMVASTVNIGSAPISSVAVKPPPGGALAQPPDQWFAAAGTTLRSEYGLSAVLPTAVGKWQVVTTEGRIVAGDDGGSTVVMFDTNLNVVRQISVDAREGGLSSLAVADINSDGKRDVIFAAGRRLYAINQAAAAVDYFPVVLPAPVTGAPIVARLAADKSHAHILVTTQTGLVLAYDNRGRAVPGFPIATAGAGRFTPAIAALPGAVLSTEVPGLFVVDSTGFLFAWSLQPVQFGPGLPWSSFRGDALHSGADRTALTGSPASVDFLPPARAYNWPNPVYDGRTFIRYFLGENASVRIRIFDLAGELVDELPGTGLGSVDNEVEWNASEVQSGIYFGHIEAQSGTQRGTAIIKIAVVK